MVKKDLGMKEREKQRKRERKCWELEREIGIDRRYASGFCSYFKYFSWSEASHASQSDYKYTHSMIIPNFNRNTSSKKG